MFSDRMAACQFKIPSLLWSCSARGFNPLQNGENSDEVQDLTMYVECEPSTLTKEDQESSTGNSILGKNLHWMMMKESLHSGSYNYNKQERMTFQKSPSKSEATATTHSSSTETHTHNNYSPSAVYQRSSRRAAAPQERASYLSFATSHPQSPLFSCTVPGPQIPLEDASVLSLKQPPLLRSSSSNIRQLEYWRNLASDRFKVYGIQHPRTAEAFVELGMAHVQCQQFESAHDFFVTAFRVMEKYYGPHDLRLAMTMERVAIAMSHHVEGYQLALHNLHRSFLIRFHRLGPDHIDTVESVNKIGTLHMKLHNYAQAKHDFLEVMTLRSAIFGQDHPSVAISAQALGQAHLQLGETEQAKAYFLQALDIFYTHGLGRNAAAQQLRRDLHSMGYDDRMEI